MALSLAWMLKIAKGHLLLVGTLKQQMFINKDQTKKQFCGCSNEKQTAEKHQRGS